MRKVQDNIIGDVIAVIDNAIHPRITFAQLASIRQALLTSPKVEDGDSTHTADSQAAG